MGSAGGPFNRRNRFLLLSWLVAFPCLGLGAALKAIADTADTVRGLPPILDHMRDRLNQSGAHVDTGG